MQLADTDSFVKNPEFELAWSYVGDRSARYVVYGDGMEAARAALSESIGVSGYRGAPDLKGWWIISLFEVAGSFRERRLGTRVVELLADSYGRLLAFSEEADEFWSSLGWDRYTKPGRFRPLYVQPLS